MGSGGRGVYMGVDTTLATIGINENISEGNNSVAIYPNPNTGTFQLEMCSGCNTEKSKIEIYNTMGECVYQATLNNEKQTIDLSSQPTGIYFVSVTIGNRKISNHKIILAK
jgi:hypothetical protein